MSILDNLDGYPTDANGNALQPVGPQSDGTFNIPSSAQPNNQPWDTGGGVLGGYGNDVLDILKYGVGLAANSYNNRQLLDYKRFEATAGGAYQQGVPANMTVPGAIGFTMSPLLMILLGLGAVLVLKK